MKSDRMVLNNEGWKFYLDGKEVTEDEYRARYPKREGQYDEQQKSCRAYPMKSDALAVHPEQIKEAMESAAKKGVPTDFDPEDGRPIFRDADHRKRYAKAYKTHDRNCFNW